MQAESPILGRTSCTNVYEEAFILNGNPWTALSATANGKLLTEIGTPKCVRLELPSMPWIASAPTAALSKLSTS